MSEAKEALISAIEESVRTLDGVFGPEDLPGPHDLEGMRAELSHADFVAKRHLREVVDILRAKAKQVHEGIELFRPEDAGDGMELLEQVRERAQGVTPNEVLRQRLEKALVPIRLVIEKYASHKSGGWLFLEEDCDPVPPWNPPPSGT